MSLVMRLADGTEVPGAATVALGPIAGPPAAAEVAEEAPAEAEAPAAVMVTGEGATVLQDPAAEVAEAPAGAVAQVTVETITYTPAGAVQLGGSGEPGPLSAFTLTMRLAGSADPRQRQVADHAQGRGARGLYAARRSGGCGGKVTSRFETPFKRETREALEAALAGTAGAAAEKVARGGRRGGGRGGIRRRDGSGRFDGEPGRDRLSRA